MLLHFRAMKFLLETMETESTFVHVTDCAKEPLFMKDDFQKCTIFLFRFWNVQEHLTAIYMQDHLKCDLVQNQLSVLILYFKLALKGIRMGSIGRSNQFPLRFPNLSLF